MYPSPITRESVSLNLIVSSNIVLSGTHRLSTTAGHFSREKRKNLKCVLTLILGLSLYYYMPRLSV